MLTTNLPTEQNDRNTPYSMVRHAMQLFILIMASVIVVACTDSFSDLVSEEAPEREALSITPEWIQSNASSSALAHELNEVRKATQKYKDVEKAIEDGYGVDPQSGEFDPGSGLVSVYVPEMGFHFTNPLLIAEDEDADHDLTKPAILVYYTAGNYRPEPFEELDKDRLDDLRLGAAEFAHSGDVGAPANYFSDENAPRNLKVSEEDGWEQIPFTPFTALHVWVHRGNPDGVFAPSNPTVD